MSPQYELPVARDAIQVNGNRGQVGEKSPQPFGDVPPPTPLFLQ
jgi:hypothetical protein